MSPSSSAIGTKVTGDTGFPSRVHRISDSNPTHIPERQQHDGLVHHLEVLGVHRVAQVVLEVETVFRPRVQVGVEHLVSCLAARLGVVHRGIGVAQNLVGTGVFVAPKAMPMLAVVNTSRPATMIRLAQRFLDAEGDDVCLLLVPDRLQQNRELVAAQTRQRVAPREARL